MTTTKMMLLATEDRDLGLVHSTKALARAKAEAKVERKMIYVRDEMTDEVEFVVRSSSRRDRVLPSANALTRRSAASRAVQLGGLFFVAASERAGAERRRRPDARNVQPMPSSAFAFARARLIGGKPARLSCRRHGRAPVRKALSTRASRCPPNPGMSF